MDVPAMEDYIQQLEKRLDVLENLAATLQAQQKGDRPSAPSTRGLEGPSDGTSDHENGEEEAQNPIQIPDSDPATGQPPSPPIELKVVQMSYTAFIYHAHPMASQPFIEIPLFPKGRKVAEQEKESFDNSIRSVRPEKALEMIRNAHLDSGPLNSRFTQFRITSKSLVDTLKSAWNLSDQDSEQMVYYRPFIEPFHYLENTKARLAEMEAHSNEDPVSPSGHDVEQEPKEPSLLAQLQFYVRFIEQDILPYYTRMKSLTASDNFSVDFEDLFHLFQLGDIIVFPEAAVHPETLNTGYRGDQKLWRVYSKLWRLKSDEFVVDAYCIDYNGDSYVCTRGSFTIWRYEGAVRVTSLKVFPIRFADNMQDLCNEAKERGQAFQRFIKSKLVSHNGWASEPNQIDPTLRFITGDVVIDFAETFKAHPDCKPVSRVPDEEYSEGSTQNGFAEGALWYWVDGEKLGESKETWSWYSAHYTQWIQQSDYCRQEDPFLSALIKGEQARYTLREEDLYLLPRRLFGYSLQDRRFVAVDVGNLTPIDYQSSKFDNLIINQAHERMLRALVESHFTRKEAYNAIGLPMTTQDIVQNKGRGLIILLHGVPGVGKTSTTETIASEFKKPLLPITSGDLGVDPATVEQSLKEIFRLAQAWDCILLLDEADVFLTERVPSDLKRNALVSVFLRVLDYYTGVLFLTTNRVGTIDEAFKSRLHVSLYYPPLKRKQTEKIWQVNLRRAAEIEVEQSRIANETPMTIDHEGIMDFARDHYQRGEETGSGVWNGRQIRNAFLIASALARFEKSRSDRPKPFDLNASHFKTVVKTGFGFERYLHEVKGRSDSEAAFLHGTRADYILSSHGQPDRNNSSPGQEIPRGLPHRPVTPVADQVNSGWNSGYQASQGLTSPPYGSYPEPSQHHAPPFLSPGHNPAQLPLQSQQRHPSTDAGAYAERWGPQPMNPTYRPPQFMAAGSPATHPPTKAGWSGGQPGHYPDSDDE